MDTLFEQQVVQNTALSAFAITQAAIRFSEEFQLKKGLSISMALLVPPLIFHRRTAENFAGRDMTEGLFFRVIADDHEISLGIQERMMSMAGDTLNAIHLACSSRLLTMVSDPTIQLFPNMRALPQSASGPETISSVKDIYSAAKRIGYCFASTEESVIFAALRVRF